MAILSHHRFWTIIGSLAIIILFTLFLHNRLTTIPDADAFYHIRHSWIYSQNGVTFNEFPWTQFSAIKQRAADLWYGFHILSLPLIYFFKDLITGIRVGGALVTITTLVLVWFSLKRLNIRGPLFWTLAFAFLSADVLYRITMFRPHSISVGLSLLLFSFFAMPAKSKNWLWIILVSFGFSWIHISLIWVPIVVWLAVNFARHIGKLSVGWQSGIAMVSGLILGWLARPNPLGAAKLAYIQVLKLLVEKQANLPIRFGRELKPFVWENFADQLIPVCILLVLAISIWLWVYFKNKNAVPPIETRLISMASFIISAGFLALSFLVARRANDFFIPFAVIFIAVTYDGFLRINRQTVLESARPIILLIAAVALIWAPLKNFYRFETYVPNAFPAEKFKDVGEWMRENLPDQTTVFNPQWDRFGELFFWNYESYYINGMDPIFEYAYNPTLYWKTHYIHTDSFYISDGVAKICGNPKCERTDVEDIYSILKRDFNASYLFLEKHRNPKLFEYLESPAMAGQAAVGFEKLYDSEIATVYKIN